MSVLLSGAVLSQGQKPGQSPQMSPKGQGSSQQAPQYAHRPYVPYNPHLTSDGSDSRAAKSGETWHAFSAGLRCFIGKARSLMTCNQWQSVSHEGTLVATQQPIVVAGCNIPGMCLLIC